MGKHKKNLRTEKAKVKFRSKQEKDRLLPKGLNITNVAFKTKKINIQSQLKKSDDSVIPNNKKLDVKILINRLQISNIKARQQTLKEMREMFSRHNAESVVSPIQPLIRGVLSLTLDADKSTRHEAIKLLHLMIAQMPSERFAVHRDIVVPFLSCTMTHINPNIREDSLLLLDTLASTCSQIIVENHNKIIPNLMDLISQLHADVPRRMLSNTLSVKMTTTKWTTKILLSISKVLNLISTKEQSKLKKKPLQSVELFADKCESNYVPIFANSNYICMKSYTVYKDGEVYNLNSKTNNLVTHINQLLPIVFDSWVEVCSKDSFNKNYLRNDEVELLKGIIAIFISITSYIDIMETKNKRESTSSGHLAVEFKDKFVNNFVGKIFQDLPYFRQSVEGKKTGKKQEEEIGSVDNFDEQNLALCYIFVWFTKVKGDKVKMDPKHKVMATKLIDFVSDKMQNWSKFGSSSRIILVNVFKILFLKASSVWYKNKLPIGNILRTCLIMYLETNDQDLQQKMFTLFEKIAMDHSLKTLHNDESFKKFVESVLPKLLSRSINIRVINLLNNLVMQHLEWVRTFLNENKDTIIENAKTIKINGTDSPDDFRYKICNLFYFTDRYIYF